MAKNDSNNKNSAAKGKKAKKKKGGPLIPILVIFVIILGVTAVIIFDLFGIRTNYLAGMLRNIPIVGNMLSPEEPSEDYTEKTSGQYQAEIDDLKTKLDTAEAALANEQEKTKMYAKEIERLSEFEDTQEQYRKDKELFDRMIAENNPNAYIQFYESMSPENQWELYKESVVTQQKSTEMTNYIKTVENMDAKAAASMLEQLLPANMDIVVMVLKNIKADIRGEILGLMKVENAASVYKFMAPEQ